MKKSSSALISSEYDSALNKAHKIVVSATVLRFSTSVFVDSWFSLKAFDLDFFFGGNRHVWTIALLEKTSADGKGNEDSEDKDAEY